MAKEYESFKSFAELAGPQGAGQGGSGHRDRPAQSGSRGGQGSGGRGPFPPPTLPKDYLPRRYFDDQGHLLPEIFIKWPEEITSTLKLNTRETTPRTTKNSLRAFYSMLQMAKREFDFDWRANKKDDAWGNAKTQLYKLRTAAHYQSTRNVISPLCQKFLEENVDAVLKAGTDPGHFKEYFYALVEHFQAVIAYLPE